MDGKWHIYAVTNKHVVDGGCHVLRINNSGAGTITLHTKPDEWYSVPDDDVAVFPIRKQLGIRVGVIPERMFMPERDRGVQALGVGDDAVLIGRLISHSGVERNKPIARFGSIAMMADDEEPIDLGGRKQVAFLVDCRSLSGSSGSAVLGYRVGQRGNMMIVGPAEAVLLGIDCAHLPFWTRVCQKQDRQSAVDPPLWVESNSGIAVVVPAWRILNLLNLEVLVKQRFDDDTALKGGG